MKRNPRIEVTAGRTNPDNRACFPDDARSTRQTPSNQTSRPRSSRHHTSVETRRRRKHNMRLGILLRHVCRTVRSIAGILQEYCRRIACEQQEYCKSTTGVMQEYCRSTAGVLQEYCGSTVGVFQEYCRSIAGILWEYSRSIAGLFQEYCGSAAGVLQE